MSQILNARPSSLLNIEDDYSAWCLDQAVMMIIISLREKRKLKPKQTGSDNRALIEKIQNSELRIQG